MLFYIIVKTFIDNDGIKFNNCRDIEFEPLYFSFKTDKEYVTIAYKEILSIFISPR